MIQNIIFKPIPHTDIEIGSAGEHASRILAFRTKESTGPIQLCTHPRAVLIGRPQAKIRQAMRDGHITYESMKTLNVPISGNSLTSLRKSLDEYLKNNLG